MSLTLGQGRTDVRVLTRHVNDTVRLTDTILNGFLNEDYRTIRTYLQTVQPHSYLAVSGNIAIPDPTTGQEIHLTSDGFRFENLYLVERLVGDDKWVEVEAARITGYNSHVTGLVAFRQEGSCVILSPDGCVEGTFRIKFHYTPAALTDTDSVFKLPESVLPALKYMTCEKVAIADGDDPKSWYDLAEQHAPGVHKAAEMALKRRNGAHPKRPGLRRRMGY